MVEIPRGGTEYIGDPVEFLRGTAADVTATKVTHTVPQPDPPPVPDDFSTDATLVANDSSPLWAGTTEIVSLIGPRGDVELTAGDHQRWVLLQTLDEDIIRSTGTVTIT